MQISMIKSTIPATDTISAGLQYQGHSQRQRYFPGNTLFRRLVRQVISMNPSLNSLISQLQRKIAPVQRKITIVIGVTNIQRRPPLLPKFL